MMRARVCKDYGRRIGFNTHVFEASGSLKCRMFKIEPTDDFLADEKWDPKAAIAASLGSKVRG